MTENAHGPGSPGDEGAPNQRSKNIRDGIELSPKRRAIPHAQACKAPLTASGKPENVDVRSDWRLRPSAGCTICHQVRRLDGRRVDLNGYVNLCWSLNVGRRQ